LEPGPATAGGSFTPPPVESLEPDPGQRQDKFTPPPVSAIEPKRPDLAAASNNELIKARNAQGYAPAAFPPQIPTMQRPAPAIPPAPLPAGLQDENAGAVPPHKASITDRLKSAGADMITGLLRMGTSPNVPGASDVAHGVEALAAPAAAATTDIGRTQLAGMGHKQPGEPALNPQLGNQAASGASQILTGATKMAAPVMVAGAVEAPLAAATALAKAGVAGYGTEKLAQASGASPEVADLLGNVAGFGAAGLSVRGSLRAADAKLEAHNKIADELLRQEQGAGKAQAAVEDVFTNNPELSKPIPIEVNGAPHEIRFVGAPNGRPSYNVVNTGTGKTVAGGSASETQAWLGQHADGFDPQNARFRVVVKDPEGNQVAEELMSRDEAAMTSDLVKQYKPDHSVEVTPDSWGQQFPVTIRDEKGNVVEQTMLNPYEADLVKDIVAKRRPGHTVEIGTKEDLTPEQAGAFSAQPPKVTELRAADPATGEPADFELRENPQGDVTVYQNGEPRGAYRSRAEFDAWLKGGAAAAATQPVEPIRTAQVRVADPAQKLETVLDVVETPRGEVQVSEAGQPVAVYPNVGAFHDGVAALQQQRPDLQMSEVAPAQQPGAEGESINDSQSSGRVQTTQPHGQEPGNIPQQDRSGAPGTAGPVLQEQGEVRAGSPGQEVPAEVAAPVAPGKAALQKAVERAKAKKAAAKAKLTPAAAAPPLTPVAAQSTVKGEQSNGGQPGVQPAAPEPTGQAHPRPLAGIPAQDVQGAGSAGQAQGNGVLRPGENGRGNGSSLEAGAAARPGVGVGEAKVGVPPGRGGRAESAEQPAQLEHHRRAAVSRDYRIAEPARLGVGGDKEKFRANLDAIKTLRKIESEGRAEATPEEKKVLAGYVGWGALAQKAWTDYFDRDLRSMREEFQGLASTPEYEAARHSSLNAHYTSGEVVQAVWRALERLGLKKNSRILEPGAGIGNFLGLQPEATLPAHRAAVELDRLTGSMLRLLYPDTAVTIGGYESTVLPKNFFDVAVSNIPFGSYGVTDPEFKRNKRLTRRIHDYYFAKALEHVRPGGVVAFVTSRYTLDKKDPFIRNYIADRAELLGAIRLPGGHMGAFSANAGTAVVTDIIFLRKLYPGEKAPSRDWTETVPITLKDRAGNDVQVDMSRYFVDHPEMLLAQPALTRGMHSDNELGFDGTLTPEALQAAIEKLPAGALTYEGREQSPKEEPVLVDETTKGIKRGGYGIVGKKLMQRNGDELQPAGLSKDAEGRVRALLGLRDAARAAYQAQIDDRPEAEITKARKELNRVYDAFVKKHGYVNAKPNFAAFGDDPDYPVVAALEDYDADAKTATKRAVFDRRTIEPYRPPKTAENATAALAVSLAEKGKIDWERIEGLLPEKTRAQIIEELGSQIFQNPDTQRYETNDEYLSGDVRKKLKAAQAAAKLEPAYERNVTALLKVQPTDLTPSQITARAGSSWIPTDVIEDFAREVLIGNAPSTWGDRLVQVNFAPAAGEWSVNVSRAAASSATNASKWGAFNLSGTDLFELALNMKSPRIYQPRDEAGHAALDVDKTNRAQDVQTSIKDEFTKWAWKDPARTERLLRIYNDEFNGVRLRQFDGSHLKFPGMDRASLRNHSLDKHQVDAVWRIIQTGNTLLAHVVGAGKTYEMIAAAMEMKRMGMIRKPIFVVPNHLVSQWEADFMRLYPNANVFAAGKQWFAKGKRQLAMARIASGDYDAIIVSHKSFEYLPVSDETFRKFVDAQTGELRAAIAELEEKNARAKAAGMEKKSKRKDPTVKRLETMLANLEKQLKDRIEDANRDRSIEFEQLGIDQIFVDEAHLFKNLYYITKMDRVAGLPNSSSNRAMDMFLKTQYLSGKYHGRGVVFATGTPISNTMAELWTMLRYLASDKLKAQDLDSFDNWAQQYGEVQRVVEMRPEGGGFRTNNRFSKFVNVADLIKLFRTVADVKNAKDLKLPTPAIRGGRPTVIAVRGSDALKAEIQRLGKRAEKIRSGQVDPKIDNMLKITHEGRIAALDMRLVSRALPDDPGSKVNRAISEVYGIWKEGAKDKLTQLMFLDMGIPKGNSDKDPKENAEGDAPADEGQATDTRLQASIYEDIKAKLVALGVPADEVRFIHEANTDAQKALLFRQVNDGTVRVLIGSTEKMGAGTNVQERLVAVHHLDAPWKPAEIEQRNGRIERQGNRNKEIRIFYYVTEDSFDGYMWDTLKRKAEFIAAAMSGDLTVREMEDADAMVLSAAEVVGLSSSDPTVKERANLELEIRRLQGAESAHFDQQAFDRRRVAGLERDLEYSRDRLAEMKDQLARKQAWEKDHPDEKPFALTGVNQPDGAALERKFAEARKSGSSQVIGHYGPFDLETTSPHFEARLQSDFADFQIQPDTNGSGLLAALTRSYNAIGSFIPEAEATVTGAEAKLKAAQETLNSNPFPKAAELAEKRARLAELDKKFQGADAGGAAQLDEETGAGGEYAQATNPKLRRFLRAGSEEPGEEPTLPHERPNFALRGGKQAIVEEAAVPLTDAARAIREAASDIKTWAVPTAFDDTAQRASLGLRRNLAEMALHADRATEALRKARTFFRSQTPADNFEFIRRMEAGEQQTSANLQWIADSLRHLLDGRRDEVQRLGTGKLRKFYENYFPHIWKNPKLAEEAFSKLFANPRKFEGRKAFLKQRTHITFQDGLGAGLTPVSDNPVDLVLMKLREMDQYLVAHRTLQLWHKQGIARYYGRDDHPPKGWRKIADPIGTVYGPSVLNIEEFPNAGLWEGLEAAMKNLGLQHVRKMKLRGGDLGQSPQGKPEIRTAHGTNESIVAHELGHAIEDRWKFVHNLWNYPGGANGAKLTLLEARLHGFGKLTPEKRAEAQGEYEKLAELVAVRQKVRAELTALADLRSDQSAAYRRDRDEMAAAVLQAWVGAREKFAEVAPTVLEYTRSFLADHAELAPLSTIQGSMTYEQLSQPYDVGGLVIRGYWWAPDGAALILNNYLSPGLRGRSGLFRAALGVNNALNQFQLGFSAFHLGFTSMDAAVSKAALGFEQILRGHPLRGIGTIAQFPAAPVSNLLRGHKLLKEWKEAGASMDPEMAAMVEAVVSAGGRAKMDEFYHTRMAERWMDTLREVGQAFHSGLIGAGVVKATKLAIQSPFAVADASTRPILDWLVPRQKLGVFADMARYDLERLGPDADSETVAKVLAAAWDSVDNRMGQLVYDNLFWNRALKDILMLNFRSVGWNIGTLREVGGGILDLWRVPKQLISGKPPSEVNLKRLCYLLALVTVTAISAAVYQFLMTGKHPQELKDYFFPRNGEKNERGEDERSSLPSYTKDIYHYSKDPWGTLANKVSPLDSLVAEMFRNKDFYGVEIRNAEDPLMKQLYDTLIKAPANAAVPLGVRNYQRAEEKSGGFASRALPFVGITPAPSTLGRTAAEELATKYMKERGGSEPIPEDTAERKRLRQAATAAFSQGKDLPPDVQQGIAQGKFSFGDRKRATQLARLTGLQREVKSLPIEKALNVYDVATPEEKQQLIPLLRDKERSLKLMPPATVKRLLPRIQTALSSTERANKQ